MKGMNSATCHTCHTVFPLNLLICILCKPADLGSYEAQLSAAVVKMVHSIHIPFCGHGKCVNVFIVYDNFDKCSLLKKKRQISSPHVKDAVCNCHLLLCSSCVPLNVKMLLNLIEERTVLS